MAWRVGVDVEEFSRKYEFGSEGPNLMGDLTVSTPRLLPNQVPSRLTISGNIPDCAWFVMAIGGGEWIVSSRFRGIVEGLEPSVHNWLPIELARSNGEPIAEPYYFFQIGQTLDTIIFERSFFNSGKTTEGEHYVTFPRTGHLMTFEKEKISGKHVWREKYAGHLDVFFSDEFVSVLKKLGLKKCFNLLDCREESAIRL